MILSNPSRDQRKITLKIATTSSTLFNDVLQPKIFLQGGAGRSNRTRRTPRTVRIQTSVTEEVVLVAQLEAAAAEEEAEVVRVAGTPRAATAATTTTVAPLKLGTIPILGITIRLPIPITWVRKMFTVITVYWILK